MTGIGTHNQQDRDAWVSVTLSNLQNGGSLLDVGAGRQRYRQFWDGRYVSQDFCNYDGIGNGDGIQKGDYKIDVDIVSDATDIPVEDESFDVVLCTEVLEHVPEPIEVLREISRIVKIDGHLVLTAPFCSLTHYSPFFFYTGFSKEFYKRFLIECGFRIIQITPNGNYFEYLAQELRRVPQMKKSYLYLPIMKIMLWILNRMSRQVENPSELLCFGYHILAKKEG